MPFEQDISKFNAMYRLPVATHPTTSQLGVPAGARLIALKDILREELEEIELIVHKVICLEEGSMFSPAQFNMPGESYVPTELEVLTDLADLLGDIQVYCASEMAKFGLPLDLVLKIIMESNFSKMGADGKPIYDERGKLLKGPNYWKPEPRIKAALAGLQPDQGAPLKAPEHTGEGGAFDPLPFVE